MASPKMMCKWWKNGVPPLWLVLSGVLFVQVGFGLYPVLFIKFAGNSNPLVFSFYRDLACFPLLFLCAFIAERKFLFPGLKMMLIFFLLGFTGIFLSQLFYILGVFWASPDVVSAFQPVIPVWTTILAALTCTEKLSSPLHFHTWIKLLGVLLATGGAVEMVLTSDMSDSNSSSTPGHTNTSSNHTSSHPVSLKLLGYISVVLNTFFTAVYLIIQKRFIFNKPENKWGQYPIYVTAYSYFFGAMFMGLSSIYYVGTRQFESFSIKGTSAYALVYAIFITSAACYLLITWSNMHISATVLTAFWPLQVLVTVIASYFISQDSLAPLQYIGAVVLLFALMLVLLSNHMEERSQKGKAVPRVDCRLTHAVSSQDQRPLINTNRDTSIGT